jgi:hypothetical protein
MPALKSSVMIMNEPYGSHDLAYPGIRFKDGKGRGTHHAAEVQEFASIKWPSPAKNGGGARPMDQIVE